MRCYQTQHHSCKDKHTSNGVGTYPLLTNLVISDVSHIDELCLGTGLTGSLDQSQQASMLWLNCKTMYAILLSYACSYHYFHVCTKHKMYATTLDFGVDIVKVRNVILTCSSSCFLTMVHSH